VVAVVVEAQQQEIAATMEKAVEYTYPEKLI
jgi:hypothetical protein